MYFRRTKAITSVVIRNRQGQVIASLSQKLPQAHQAMEIEALAAARAIELGIELGIIHAILEGDSRMIIKALANEDGSLASHAPLIQDVKLLSWYFS